MSDTRRDPVLHNTVRVSWFDEWLENKLHKNRDYSRDVVFLSKIGVVVSLEFQRFDYDAFYIPSGEAGRKEFKNLKNYSVAHLGFDRHFHLQAARAVLFHEMGHHICNHDEKLYNLTPTEITIHEVQAWERAVDLWDLWGVGEFPKEFALDYLSTYGMFAEEKCNWKERFTDYLKQNTN